MYGVQPHLNLLMDFGTMFPLFDNCTRYCWIFPLHNKSNVARVFGKYKAYIENLLQTKIKIIRTDGGGEYVSYLFQSILTTSGIHHQKSCPYTPEQNGIAERKHRHIVETALALMSHASLPSHF